MAKPIIGLPEYYFIRRPKDYRTNKDWETYVLYMKSLYGYSHLRPQERESAGECWTSDGHYTNKPDYRFKVELPLEEFIRIKNKISFPDVKSQIRINYNL